MRTPAASVYVLALGSLLFGGSACRRPAPPPQPAVATFEGGSISAADLDRAILDVPSQLRQPADGDLLAWYERIARDLAVQQILLAEARAAGLGRGPEFGVARAEAAKQAAVAEFIEKQLPRPEAPTEAQLKAYYEAHKTEFTSGAARQTWHIFRRQAPGADPKALLAEVQGLRRRVLAGEDFRELAAVSSDSESRHRKGLLGWVRAGQFNPTLERVIFSLTVNVPSEPLRTREGVHMFLVTAETPQRNYGLADVRAALALRLTNEERNAEIARRVGPAPAGSLVPDAEAWKALVQAGDPQAVVLQVGDLRLTMAEFEQRLLVLQASLDLEVASAPLVLLHALTQRELIYRHCRKLGLDRSPDVEARLQRVLERELAGLRLRQRLLERAERDPARLEEYYRANRARFSEPLKLRVQRLQVPLSASANAAMARLEQARGDLDRGRLTLGALAAELGGTVEEPGWQTLGQLAQQGARLAALAATLAAGRHAPPYREGDQLEMVGVKERQEPAPLPFNEVRLRVRADYVFNHRHEEYAELVKEVLAQSRFQVARERLEELLRRPPGAVS